MGISGKAPPSRFQLNEVLSRYPIPPGFAPGEKSVVFVVLERGEEYSKHFLAQQQ
jgi:hypothetical protein